MSNIKTQYAEIVALLEANKNKKVSTMLPQILELVTTKQNSKNFIKDSEGNVTSVYCYYHKQWEEVSTHEYGKKASSATGLASMCKVGVSHWTKQQRAKKAAETALLASLAHGSTSIKDLPALQEAINNAANAIVPIV
jgi:membrane-associated PAP2 superfamily phosphatase